MARLLPLLALGCAGADADFDGFAAADDCNDADPLIYPGAADLPGDGVDADCDGEDPPHPFIGTWTLLDYGAELFGQPYFDVPITGALTISDALVAHADLEVDYGLPLPLEMEGRAVPFEASPDFVLLLEGVLAPGIADQAMAADLDCVRLPGGDPDRQEAVLERLDCQGALAVGASLSAAFLFERLPDPG